MSVLASAEFVDRSPSWNIQRSDRAMGMVHSRRINTLRPQEFTLRWETASRATIADVFRFVEEHLQGGQFDYTPPLGIPGKFELAEDSAAYQREGAIARIDVPIRLALATDP